MNKILIFIIAFISLNCISEAKSIYFPGFFYHKYQGIIGDKKATLDLIKIDSTASGFFYFKGENNPLQIMIDSSFIKNNSNLQFCLNGITDYDSLSIPTTIYEGKLTGKFTDIKRLEGLYKYKNSKPESFVFILDEADNYARMKMEKMSTVYTNAETNFSMKFKMNYPKFYHTDLSEYKAVNDSIRRYFLFSFSDSGMVFLENIGHLVNKWYQINKPEFDLLADDTSAFDYTKEETEEFYMQQNDWSSFIDFVIELNEENILSLCKVVEEDYGGFHPMTSYLYYNFDLTTQKEILLSDIFLPEKRSIIDELALKELIRMDSLNPDIPLSEQDFWFENDIFYLSENFSIRPNGIKFIYNPYEIAPFVRGNVEILLPHSQIKEYLQKNTVIYKYINK